MALVKSHSNYVLKKRHQDINDGTIFERDITTIGGFGAYTPGQTPIYSSSNFIITVRDDGKVATQYNQSKWNANETSGNVWTMESISGMTSESDDQNDLKIVLKQDYYDFKDFVYYGSLSEMFRASINDILRRFPGELYGTDKNAYFTSGTTDSEREMLGRGDETLKYVDNPFGIDIHSKKKPMDGDSLKYFADEGYKNYEIDGETILTYDTEYTDEPLCKGNHIATITANTIVIEAWVGDEGIVYLSRNMEGKHIRPNESFLDNFYNKCDNFQKVLLNPNTTPKYKSVFSVIRDNAKGFYREMQEFVFPTTYGDYNIDAASYGFNDFTNRLSEIGEYYDELFTDNLYRAMTHEAIKNFDWSYTREFSNGDEEEYVYGGEKIQKALRVFAREFDEILSFINNIKNVGRVTYDERGNIPDYFLVDEAEKKGWNTKFIYPYDLVEKTLNGNEFKSEETEDEKIENEQLNGGGVLFNREFSQNPTKKVYPYGKSRIYDYPDGYFITCNLDSGDTVDIYENYNYINASGLGTTLMDGRTLRNRMKAFTDEKEYTYMDVNNEFLRRLVINSPYIWRHKGTVEGIDMILGLFGLKSKKWWEEQRNKTAFQFCKDISSYDYEIKEYSSFAEPIEDEWDAIHQMYRIEWINTTKTIVYDNRSTSNYTTYGTQLFYQSYQGLPVVFKDIEIDEDSNSIKKRKLYPYFDKKDEIDGNPYFQMDGGWYSNTLEGKYNFQFDVDNNICYTSISNFENNKIYKETIRNIRKVDTLAQLITLPSNQLTNGCIYYVTNVEKDVAILDNSIYKINYEYNPNGEKPYRYITLRKNADYIKVGEDRYFDRSIITYDKTYTPVMLDLSDRSEGYEVKAYIKDDGSFICQESEDGYYGIDSFATLDNINDDKYSNYFIIDDKFYCNRLSVKNGDNGWRRLKYSDSEYIRINTVVNYYKGNNPHNGNMVYDNGHKYFTYFNTLFKHAIDNNLFDTRCYEYFFGDAEEIRSYGFRGLICENESIKNYDLNLIEDSKIHYFGNYYKRDGNEVNNCNNVMLYTDNDGKVGDAQYMYHKLNDSINVDKYILTNKDSMIGGSPYSPNTEDEITHQIVNNKRLDIIFYLHNKWFTEQGQCELKYIDDIVNNYLSQMIPSTAIVSVGYWYNKEVTPMKNKEYDEKAPVIESETERKYIDDSFDCNGDNLTFYIVTENLAPSYTVSSITSSVTKSEYAENAELKAKFGDLWPCSNVIPNWQPTGVWWCEYNFNGSKNGTITIEMEDTNEESSSYGNKMTSSITESMWTNELATILHNTSDRDSDDTINGTAYPCRQQTTVANWVPSDCYCMLDDPSKLDIFNGTIAIEYQDENVNSPTSGQTKTEYLQEYDWNVTIASSLRSIDEKRFAWVTDDFPCKKSNVSADWQIVENKWECVTVEDANGNEINDGRLRYWVYDANELSPTHNDEPKEIIISKNGWTTEIANALGQTSYPCEKSDTTPTWEIVKGSWTCGTDNSGKLNGSLIYKIEDINELSSTYGNTKDVTITENAWGKELAEQLLDKDKDGNYLDHDGNVIDGSYPCGIPSGEADWQVTYYECLQKPYGKLGTLGCSGVIKYTVKDVNEYSLTYNAEKEYQISEDNYTVELRDKLKDLLIENYGDGWDELSDDEKQKYLTEYPCTPPDTTPIWEYSTPVDYTCVLKSYPRSGLEGPDGNVNVFKKDTNIYSDTYGDASGETMTRSDFLTQFGIEACQMMDETPRYVIAKDKGYACETKEYGPLNKIGNSGVMSFYLIDENEYSDTYYNEYLNDGIGIVVSSITESGLTDEIRSAFNLTEFMCKVPDTRPNWEVDETFSGYCETMEDAETNTQGSFVYRMIDTNEYSDTYGTTEEKHVKKGEWADVPQEIKDEYGQVFPCMTAINPEWTDVLPNWMTREGDIYFSVASNKRITMTYKEDDVEKFKIEFNTGDLTANTTSQDGVTVTELARYWEKFENGSTTHGDGFSNQNALNTLVFKIDGCGHNGTLSWTTDRDSLHRWDYLNGEGEWDISGGGFGDIPAAGNKTDYYFLGKMRV